MNTHMSKSKVPDPKLLSNYEVLDFLKGIDDAGKTAPEFEEYLTIKKEVLHRRFAFAQVNKMLIISPDISQSKDQIPKFMAAMEPFGLTKIEKLMILNSRPTMAVELHLLIEEADAGRFTEEQQGAEARVFVVDFGDRKAIVKERFRKLYRLPALDEKLTSRRLLQEARCLHRCRKAGIDTPTLYLIDSVNSQIYMEYVEGQTVRDRLRAGGYVPDEVPRSIGNSVAMMHAMDIVHGDLTTSNMMIRAKNSSLALIDFGLSYVSTLVEDKALDAVLDSYKTSYSHGAAILKKLEEVRKRGRKRNMVG
ncbi:hypothetical protein HK101_009223 [Irineochytrium annulatum]|nr:hypothetical protein HK101_009223 [Irineochytrium annulatum]